MKQVCDKNMSFQDCELAILRMQVDQAQEKMSRRIVESPETTKILKIVENFIKKRKLVCYGGIAINALLPAGDKIYNEDIDLPDYDFFSPNAVEDAKRLADEFYKQGFKEVEAKAAQHHNTFKVYVNFMGVADITYLSPELFKNVKKSAVKKNGIYYTDPNFLKMGMYLELSRPSGDTDRWEKVLKRLTLINKYYPIDDHHCKDISFQRKLENPEHTKEIYDHVQDILIDEKVVFFGGDALARYKSYMPSTYKHKVEAIPDFDVISNDPLHTAEVIEDKLSALGYKVDIYKKEPVGEIVPEHYEVKLGKDTIVFIYKSIACHSYNLVNDNGKQIRVATIDTILSFYFAFLYADRPYYDNKRLLCMANLLFKVQEKNRLEQKGVLKRFSITCMGRQPSREDMREEKTRMHELIKKGDPRYDEWFLNYTPGSATNKTKTKTLSITNTTKTKTAVKSVKVKKLKGKKSKTNKRTKRTKTKKRYNKK